MRSATSKSRSGRFAGAVLGISLAFGPRAARGQAYQVIHDFNGADASQPYAGLIRASDGNFYGTAPQGGAYNLGVTYRMDSSQNVQVMFSFPTNQFRYPASEMIESSGYLYGTAGASSGDQFVFRMDFLGNVTPLARVPCGPDSLFFDGLTEAFGSFYGVATGCGKGFLYRVDSSGTLTTLHSFSGRDGSTPQGDLILGTDGYLYGVTIFGGVYNGGTVFRADSQGNVTSIHSFDPCCGGPAYPRGRLLEASGELYGTTSGGASGRGTAYRMDFNGNVTVLHDFAGSPSDGDDPSFGLTQRTTGFYGTTGAGGDFGGGTVFQTDASGNTATIHSFGDIGDGATPMGELLNDSGALYGTTRAGGYGTIFMMTFKPKVIKLKKTAGPVFVRPGVPIQMKGVLFVVGGPAPLVTFGGLPATDVVVEDSETIDVLTPVDLSPGTLNDVTVTSEDGTSTTLERAWLGDFLDVPSDDVNHDFVERVFRARLMEGCGAGNFCQTGTLDRGDYTILALKAKHGPAWAPPACTGQFHDVRCPGPEADWIEAAVSEGIAEACARNRFCPSQGLRRETMPELVLKTKHGGDYTPPPCTGIFRDVRCGSKFADAIEQLYREGVVEACSTDPIRYCPNRDVDRVSMARYAVKAFRLP